MKGRQCYSIIEVLSGLYTYNLKNLFASSSPIFSLPVGRLRTGAQILKHSVE